MIWPVQQCTSLSKQQENGGLPTRSAGMSSFDVAFSLGDAPYVTIPPVLSVVTAVAMGAALLLRFLTPSISMLECVAAAAPVGLTLSAWISLFLKSFVFQSADGLPPSMSLVGTVIQVSQ